MESIIIDTEIKLSDAVLTVITFRIVEHNNNYFMLYMGLKNK